MFHTHDRSPSSSASKAAAHQTDVASSGANANAVQRKPEEKKPQQHAEKKKGMKQLAPKEKPKQRMPMQRKANNTGLPNTLKSGIENLSGQSMDDVKVHYNSAKPAQFQAHAFAQGSNIHVAPGQNKHLAHEAWHVVQQKQGRVQPTTKVNGAAVNDSPTLEREADTMGAKAMQHKPMDKKKK